MTLMDSNDTIVALASGRGTAGVAVLRLSGPDALRVINDIFRAARAKTIKPAQLTYGSVVDSAGEVIDDCLVALMPAPHSFTGEDVAEIQCHGSSAVISRILDRCLEVGARIAQPGEYSRRAFLNGKMDLAQAEALTDLISAKSEAARRLALRQLRGGLSGRLRTINSMLLDAAAEIEAHIDFPEEDIPSMAQERILASIDDALSDMRRLLAGHNKARIKTDGARVVLAGEPNAGKSSLFNALVGRERAIVSPHPGTTRDTIEAVLDIGGLAITLVDTAGIRQGAEEIEQIGIDRSLEEIVGADLVLHLAEEGSNKSEPKWSELEGIGAERIVRVWTKCDRIDKTDDFDNIPGLQLSSATGAGLSRLEMLLCRFLIGQDEDDPDAEMSRVRHAENLSHAAASAELARQAFSAGESGDLVMVDLREALSSIGEIFGERLDEQILDRVFSTFCLGK